MCGSSRWWRTTAPRTATSGSAKPSLRPICTANDSPTTEWSPPRPLPMSCSRLLISSRSGRATWVVRRGRLRAGLHEVPVDRPDVRAVARREVAHGAPLREQPPPQAGAVERLHDVHERTAGAQQRQQLAPRRPRPRLPQLGRGVGEPVQRARGHREPGAGGGGRDAQHAARGRGRRWRRGPARPRPPCSTTPLSSGRRTGGRRNAASPRRGSALRAWRSPTSAANATERAAPERALASSKRSAMSRLAATSSASWARSTSRARPAMRCSSVRTFNRRSRPSSTSRDGRSTSCAAASASISWTSRRPPCPLLRSGSTRCATSPDLRHRSWAPSAISS